MPLPLLIGLGVAAAAAAVAAVAMSDDNSSSDNDQARLNAENEEKRENAKLVQKEAEAKAKLTARKKLLDTEFLKLAEQYSLPTDDQTRLKSLIIHKTSLNRLKSHIENIWPNSEISKKLSREIKDLDVESKQLNANIQALKEIKNA